MTGAISPTASALLVFARRGRQLREQAADGNETADGCEFGDPDPPAAGGIGTEARRRAHDTRFQTAAQIAETVESARCASTSSR